MVTRGIRRIQEQEITACACTRSFLEGVWLCTRGGTEMVPGEGEFEKFTRVQMLQEACTLLR